MEEVIRLSDVTYSYPLSKKPALKNINLSFEKGKFYGIIGENASGKSTLCNVIRGLCPNFYLGEISGSVIINGKEMKDIDERKLVVDIGYVFQNPFIQISGIRDTVFEEVGLGLENMGFPREEIMKRVIDVSRRLHITELLDKNPLKLSGGQCQRVAFASIVAMGSEIMVIDEPTSQLDPEGTKDIFEIIRLLKEEGKTIILVEHKINMISEYCDGIVVLKDGEVVAAGPTREVLTLKELEKSGAPFPVAVQFGRAMEDAGMPLRYTPITNTEAAELILERS